jgi:predicted transcriptional regulator
MDELPQIRKRRVALGMSLGELARAVGRSDATISRIERGRIRPSYDLVQQILNVLETREGAASPRLTVAEIMNRDLVTVDATAAVATAAQRLEGGAFSQLPVVDAGRVVGSVSESALLRALAAKDGKRARVRDVLEGAYPIVDEEFPAELLPGLFSKYPAVLIARRGVPIGIVTKADLIRGLRGQPFRRAAAD